MVSLIQNVRLKNPRISSAVQDTLGWTRSGPPWYEQYLKIKMLIFWKFLMKLIVKQMDYEFKHKIQWLNATVSYE